MEPPGAIYLEGPTTKRLRLRAAVEADAPAYYSLNTDPDVMRYTGEEPPKSEEEMRERIVSYPDFERWGFGRWACEHRESGRVIGFAGLKMLEELGEVDLGYRFLPEFWGQGLATEASTACLEFAFDVLALDHVIGIVLPKNGASARVLEKVGMRFDREIEYFGHRALRYICRRGG